MKRKSFSAIVSLKDVRRTEIKRIVVSHGIISLSIVMKRNKEEKIMKKKLIKP